MSQTEDFASLLGEYENTHTNAAVREPEIGETVRGHVVSVQETLVFIDLGAKTEGVADIEEFTDADGRITVQPGDEVELPIGGLDQASGAYLLGTRHARHVHGSEGLRQAYAEGQPVEGRISGVTKGGVEVEVSGARGFCPASQVGLNFVEDMSPLVGQKLAFRITKLEGGRQFNVLLSHRAILEEEQRAQAVLTRQQLQVGAVMQGRVTGLKDFGAFVDLGGVEGMIHVSELSYGRISHPQEVLSVGQEVEVSVLRIEQTDNPKRPERIALSIRALAADPWNDAVKRHPAGSRVQGRVTRLEAFGVFVEIAPGVEGLVHISELGAKGRVGHPREVVQEGQEVAATVLDIDLERRRISLTLDTEKAVVADAAPASAVTSTKAEKSENAVGTFGELLREQLKRQ